MFVMSRITGKRYFVYVLWSDASGRFYTGISENPAQRLQQHNSGELKGWTARFRPWEIIHTEEFADYAAARRRENELKAQKGGKGFFLKTGINPAQYRRGS